jgi:hypothetical protein
VITSPPGWTQHFGAHLVTLYPPEGGGRIRFYERIRPVLSFSALLERVLADDPEFRVSAVHEPREIITSEGEYGAWVRITGSRESGAATHFIGAVFTDEFAAALDTLVVVRGRSALLERTARELLVESSFALGVRRRRFVYRPPPGWQAIPSGLVANWYPPDFPDNNANIVVAAAEPSSADPAEHFSGLLAAERSRGTAIEAAIERSDIRSSGGLVGSHWQLILRRPGTAGRLHRDIVAYQAPPYLYTLGLESLTEARLTENRELFGATARSAMPIPPAQPRSIGPALPTSAAGAFSHWID